MNLNEHIIIEEFDARAVYEIHELPRRGQLIKNGAVLKKGDRFTQGDIRSGAFQYRHTANEGNVEQVFDDFYFKVALNDTDFLTPDIPRPRCLPAAAVPQGGIYRFRIRITCVPFPRQARNNMVSLMETETKCLSRNDLFYTSMTSQIQAYFEKPDVRVRASEAEVFQRWKRFAGEESFENAGRTSPPDSDVRKWEYDGEKDSINFTTNSSNFTGLVNTTTSEAYKLKATLSSTARDDDFIGIVVAYYEENGVPQTISVGRAGGLNGAGASGTANTWFVYRTNGNEKTILTDNSYAAPNQFNNTKNQSWDQLGKTVVEVVRKGNTVVAKCSQFSFGAADPFEIDDGTAITINLPAPFNEPAQYGFAAYSQAFATIEDVQYAELPWPEIVPPVPEPEYDRLWERFPIEYTVTRKSAENRGRFLLNGSPLNVGDTFYHKDIDRGLLCIEGKFNGPGKETFNFTACANENKCVSGVFTANIIEWPYPKATRNNATIDECDDSLVLTPDMFTVEVEFGSTPSQISIVLDEAATIAANNDNNKVGIQPTSFTMQDIIDGNVEIFHECGADPTLWRERLVFTACSQYNKCRSVTLNVKVIPLPVVKPPTDPSVFITPAGCAWNGQYWFDGTPIISGTCGLWAELRGRVLPDPSTYPVGQILYMPDVQPTPKTMVLVPIAGGNDWRESPLQLPTQPTGNECVVREVAPNTDRSKSLIELGLWGTWGEGPPGFMVTSGGKNLLPTNAYVTDLFKVNQGDGEQYFSIAIPTSQLGNGPVEVVYTDNRHGPNDRNLLVKWVTVNGKRTTFNRMLYLEGEKVSIPGPFDMAPYLGPANTCFTALDGTIWATNRNGQWAYVEGGTGDFTPIIKSTPEYMVQVNNLADVPAGNTQPIWIKKPVNTVFTPLKEDFIVEPKPFTETFILDEFQWIDSNEFWLPFGASFDLYFFANRYYTRFDILPDSGNQLIHPTSPLVAGINGGILAKRQPTSTFNNSQNALNVIGAVGTWPTKVSQAIVPGKTMYEGFSQENNLTPFDADPHKTNSYLVKIAGTNSYAGFVASQRPKLMPKTITGPRWYDSSGKPGFSRTYEAWEEADYKTVWSNSGYNGDYKQINADFSFNGKGEIAAFGGPAYGTLYPWLHFDAWKLYSNNNYTPARQPLGWCTARLSFLDYSAIRDSKEARNGGPVNSAPPSSPTTFTFRVRAYDIATGEEKVRTYKVHWTATGKNPKGKTQAKTDAATGIPYPPGTLPPRPGTAVCFFDDQGAIGSCRILKDNEV